MAARLAADARIERVIGIDGDAPSTEVAALLPSRVEVVQADLRTPAPAKILIAERVDAVVHLAVASAADPHAGGRAGDERAQRHRHDAAARRLPAGARPAED